MDWLRFITREESIAGLEVGETYLRLALLEVNSKTKKPELQRLRERPLQGGIMVNGEVADKPKFIRELSELLKNRAGRVNYAVVSIPANSIYSHIYSFPKTVSGEKLEESMKLTIGFQLPVPPEKMYLDWEKIETKGTNDIFLATIPKPIVDKYMDILKTAGLRTVAIEFAPASLSRVIDAPAEQATAAVIMSQSGTTVSVLEGKILRFTRFLPAVYFPDKNMLSQEIKKIFDFYEAERKMAVAEVQLVGGAAGDLDDQFGIPVNPARIVADYALSPELKTEPGKWLVSLGAAVRGIMTRAEDNLVSLMPVGTEEAYENQKATAFVEFLSTVIIGLSIFFVVIYGGTWLFLVSVQTNLSRQLQGLGSASLPTDAIILENQARRVNAVAQITAGMVRSEKHWSLLLEELRARITPGITVSAVSIPSSADAISITGVARSRSELNAFRKSLEESAWLAEVNLPLSNVTQRENIGFSASFRLRDPARLIVQ
ncbi:MAG: pilus assembly protein PilM [Patescibacteria group bacterium]